MSLLREYIRAIMDQRNAKSDLWEDIFQKIRDHKLYGLPMPKVNIDSLATAMNDDMGYDVDRAAFTPVKYDSFDEWFLRRLAPETMRVCSAQASLADVCSPVQGTIRKKVPAGTITLKKSVIIVDKLLDLVRGSDLLQISLQKTDYHRVHSPVDGKVTAVGSLNKDELFPGSEAMVIIEIESTLGKVKVMSIGEWTVQTFVTDVQAGDIVKKLDELGHFYFGSQVIVVLPKGVSIIVNREGKQRVFPGDPVGVAV